MSNSDTFIIYVAETIFKYAPQHKYAKHLSECDSCHLQRKNTTHIYYTRGKGRNKKNYCIQICAECERKNMYKKGGE